MKDKIKLNIHTINTKMSGVIDYLDIIYYCKKNGYKSIGISDLDSVASFPKMYELTRNSSDIKVIYGAEIKVRYGGVFKVKLLCRDQKGLKNLYKIISVINNRTDKNEEILRSFLKKNREGILIGASGIEGELFFENRQLLDEEILNRISWYDYIVINPSKMAEHLIGKDMMFEDKYEYMQYVKKIIKIGKENKKIIIAQEDVYALDEEDVMVRKILLDNRENEIKYRNIENTKIYTNEELEKEFEYLPQDIINEIIYINLEKINSLTRDIEILNSEIKFPKIENDEIILKEKINKIIKNKYGENINQIILDRISCELYKIYKTGSASNFLIASDLVKKTKKNGFLAQARGEIGSFLVAKLLGITGCDPLPPYYICTNCKKMIFSSGKEKYTSGFDMENRKCPNCDFQMKQDGQNIKLKYVLNKDIIPKMNFNFNDEEKYKVTEYIKNIVGNDRVFFVGVGNTVGEKKSKKDVIKYINKNKIKIEKNRLEKIINKYSKINTNVIKMDSSKAVLIPTVNQVEDYTPIDTNMFTNRITHFKYEDLSNSLFLIEGKSYRDLDMLNALKDMAAVDIDEIQFYDEEVYKLFSNKNNLYGIDFFCTQNYQKILSNREIKKFSDLVELASDIYSGNKISEINIANTNKANKNKLIFKEDIYDHLIKYRIRKSDIVEMIEKMATGELYKIKEEKNKYYDILIKAGVESDMIKSFFERPCVFPKAHIINYVEMAYQIAYFKVYYPLEFYVAYLNLNIEDIELGMMFKTEKEISQMIKGSEDTKTDSEKNKNISSKANKKINKKINMLNIIKEMKIKKIDFVNVNLQKSKENKFVFLKEENKIILPYFFLDK